MEKKRYVVMELWGGLLQDDLEFESENRRQAIQKYIEHRKLENVKIVYDSIKNHVMGAGNCLCIQEGHYQGGIKYIRGRRGFYQIIPAPNTPSPIG